MKHRAFDLLGNMAVVNFPKDYKLKQKKQFAGKLMKDNRNIKTVLEKYGKVKGRLRIPKTRYILGEKTKEILYRENNCVFRFNIDKTYFSPRLSNERKEVASLVKSKDEVLVMFAGVAPFSIVIAKNPKVSKVYSNEINRVANKYARLNIERNKVKDKIVLLDGNIKKVALKLKGQKKKFDLIVMARPQLKDTFLEQAFMLSKKGTRIIYYDFCQAKDKDKIIEKVKSEAKKSRKNIKILRTKTAGEIAPYKIRLRIDLVVA